jgi:hypothetical protein
MSKHVTYCILRCIRSDWNIGRIRHLVAIQWGIGVPRHGHVTTRRTSATADWLRETDKPQSSHYGGSGFATRQ